MDEGIPILWNLISTLLATLVGGILTFTSTYILENRKLKKEMKIKNLSTILLPYCESIEELLEKMKLFQTSLEVLENRNYYRKYIDDFNNLREGINEVKKYSRVSNRLGFSKKTRELLDKYLNEVDYFESMLRADCNKYQSEFHEYIVNILDRYITVGVEQHVRYSLNKDVSNLLEIAFLARSPIALSKYISSVSYYEDVSPSYGGNCVSFDFSGENFLYYWNLIEDDLIDIKAIEDDELKQSCSIKHSIITESNDKQELKKLILDTSYTQLLEKQIKMLKNMRIQIIKEIDKL